MATDTFDRIEDGIARGASGVTTGDATVLTVTLGWKPQTVKIVDVTNVITWEKIDGMTDAQSVKTVTAGTTTIDATSAIVLTDTGFTTSAALNASAATLVWYAS